MTLDAQKQALAKAFPEVLRNHRGYIDWEREGLQVLHECERLLTRDECVQYNVTLCKIVIPLHHLFPPHTSEEYPAYQYLFNATWQQRLEDILRVKGLWMEGEQITKK